MIYTIGHSTRTPDEFIRIANKRFKTLIDIRSHPTSKFPQWQQEHLRNWVRNRGANYVWWPSLGGWNIAQKHLVNPMLSQGVDIRPYLGEKFPKQRIAIDATAVQSPGWTNVGLRDYSYFMATQDFLHGAERLILLEEEIEENDSGRGVAIMCAEAMWWKCHRSMVSDYLLNRGVDSYHIMNAGKAKPHSEVISNRLERYEPYVRNAWDLW